MQRIKALVGVVICFGGALLIATILSQSYSVVIEAGWLCVIFLVFFGALYGIKYIWHL